jgi:hypothetical protein
MASVSVKTRVKPDGILEVAIPTGLPETDVDVQVVIRPLPAGNQEGGATGSWPEGFFDKTFGCLADDPPLRGPHLPHETREELL